MASEVAPPIAFEAFLRVDIRAGTILNAEPHAEARNPAYRLSIDFGPDIGIKKSSAQVAALYQADELKGRQVACVVNFLPRQIGKLMSEVLVLGFPDARGAVSLVTVSPSVPNGGRLF